MIPFLAEIFFPSHILLRCRDASQVLPLRKRCLTLQAQLTLPLVGRCSWASPFFFECLPISLSEPCLETSEFLRNGNAEPISGRKTKTGPVPPRSHGVMCTIQPRCFEYHSPFSHGTELFEYMAYFCATTARIQDSPLPEQMPPPTVSPFLLPRPFPIGLQHPLACHHCASFLSALSLRSWLLSQHAESFAAAESLLLTDGPQLA